MCPICPKSKFMPHTHTHTHTHRLTNQRTDLVRQLVHLAAVVVQEGEGHLESHTTHACQHESINAAAMNTYVHIYTHLHTLRKKSILPDLVGLHAAPVLQPAQEALPVLGRWPCRLRHDSYAGRRL